MINCKRRPECVGGLRSVIHKLRNIFIVQTFGSAPLTGLFSKKRGKDKRSENGSAMPLSRKDEGRGIDAATFLLLGWFCLAFGWSN